MLSNQIPLKILVCDGNDQHVQTLMGFLRVHASVHSCKAADKISAIQQNLRAGDFNAIFIDPLSFDFDRASDLIFSIRVTLPEIVFVLYVNLDEVESCRSTFFMGERARFNHYYKLDKRTRASNFGQELDAVLQRCQLDLRWRLSTASLERLRGEVAGLERLSKAEKSQEAIDGFQDTIVKRIEDTLAKLPLGNPVVVEPNSVFVSYSFDEKEYFEGIEKLLKKRGLQVITGARANSSISVAIIERIKRAECFLSLMTRDKQKQNGFYTTSTWLIEEKGAAVALGKPIILMVEDGVDDIGGLQGDWQRIHFQPKAFTVAALEAVEQAASYAGIGTVR